MQNQIQDAFDATRIQDALDSIRAEEPLIARTRQMLVEQCRQPDLAARLNTVKRRQMQDRRRLVAALAFVVLAGIVLAGMAVINTPIAAISIDLDRAVILQVNRLHRVVDISVHASGPAWQPEAAERLAKLPAGLSHQTLEAAVSRLITDAAKAPDSSIDQSGATIITFATAADSLSLQVALSQKVEGAAAKALASANREAVLYMEFAGYDRVLEARQLDMTPGRLNLIRKLIELAPDTLVSDCAKLDNMDIMRLVVEKTQSGARPANQGQASGLDNGSQGSAGSGTDGKGTSGSEPSQGAMNGQNPMNGNGQSGEPAKGNAGSGNGSENGNGAVNSNGNVNSNGIGLGQGPAHSGTPAQGGKASSGLEPGDRNGVGNAQGSAGSQGNGSGNGSANGNGSGNGNGNGNGGANGGKGVQSGNANGKPENGRDVNDAALQRIRQALARSAENARRNSKNKN